MPHKAIEAALEDSSRLPAYGVPLHLRNAPTSFMKRAGYGRGYKYPHDFPGHIVDQTYLPEELKGRIYYQPTDLGRELSIRERLAAIRKHRKE